MAHFQDPVRMGSFVLGVLIQADELLRGRRQLKGVDLSWKAIYRLIGFVLACGLVYGAAMGTFGGLDGDRPWQVVFSAVKVPLLLLVTLALSLPSFFVV